MDNPTSWQDVVATLLPVGTLLLGAGLGRLGKQKQDRRAAAELLAELKKVAWTKGGDDDYLDLQVFLGRLRVSLRSAGVPPRLIKLLMLRAEDHWQAVEYSGDPDVGWGISGKASRELDEAEGWVLDWLDRPWHLVRRLRAVRAARSSA